jgi:glycosyltransferase involved in cell wall biosynthesis
MRVLMLGWEFPPFISGGLGTACFGITKALSDKNVEILFVLPKIKSPDRQSHVEMISASEIPIPKGSLETGYFLNQIEFHTIDSIIRPYMNQLEYRRLTTESRNVTEKDEFCVLSGDYGADLVFESYKFGQVVGRVARDRKFDIIHGHDWLTALAGIEAKRISGSPFIYHVHALEFDRSGENIDQNIYDIERLGMQYADHIIAVSNYTKNMITNRYGISPEKITVVHNAVNREERASMEIPIKRKGEKIVLFLGRVTFQKGPDYFIEAASIVLKHLPNVNFIMAGTGDMWPAMIERVAQLGMGKRFHFLGFISGVQIEQIFAMSDLYVMPSISEPFGIAPLEAMLHDVPVIISNQSGVSEILNNVLKVDFWDTRELANKIISVLSYPALSDELVSSSRESLRTIHWEDTAKKIISVYNQSIQ